MILIEGINNIAIESGLCSWASPKDTWSDVSFPVNTENYLSKGEKLVQSVYSLIQKMLENHRKQVDHHHALQYINTMI